MNLPRFTAEASFYPSSTQFRVSATNVSASSRGAIVPARSRTWGRFCAITSNLCTYGCDPFDGGCRGGCNDYFFDCLDADPTL